MMQTYVTNSRQTTEITALLLKTYFFKMAPNVSGGYLLRQ